MIVPFDLALLSFLVVIAITAITMRDLLATIVLLGVYSFVMACVWVEMNAVDVGFVEAAIGAGVTTALMIAALSRTTRWEKK